jgi:hypothetical protein
MKKTKAAPQRKAIGFSPPLEIEIYSDGNVLRLINNKNGQFTYRYVKSSTKLNQSLTLDEEGIIKLLKWNIKR